MYNIHSHYNFVYSFLENRLENVKLGYFFPFGSTSFSNLEFLDGKKIDYMALCFDQEPLDLKYNNNTFENFNSIRYEADPDNPRIGYTSVYSNILKLPILIDNGVVSYGEKYLPAILLNTEKDSEEKEKILKKFNFIDCYYFFHGLAVADWYRGYEYSNSITPIKQRKISKKFISYNRITGNSRIYRAIFVGQLFKRELLKYGHVSFSKICPEHGNLKVHVLHAIKKYNLSTDTCKSILANLELLDELRIDTPKDTQISNHSFNIGPIKQSMESFLHIVTETCFWEKKKHLTEKIFKPIVLKQPFVLLGCANNLSYFKEYGFKTFNKWWDESYDECQDPMQRIEMVTNIVEEICRKSDEELEKMLIEMEEILEHNFNLLYSKEFVKKLWDELSTNLINAIEQLPPPTSVEN
jgi:hypothetical protein